MTDKKNVKLDPKTFEKLKKRAKKDGKTIGGLLKGIIENYVKTSGASTTDQLEELRLRQDALIKHLNLKMEFKGVGEFKHIEFIFDVETEEKSRKEAQNEEAKSV
ncbi:MAG: hypothetical protein V3W45_06245 [Sedimentisphaerales bacterium]